MAPTENAMPNKNNNSQNTQTLNSPEKKTNPKQIYETIKKHVLNSEHLFAY